MNVLQDSILDQAQTKEVLDLSDSSDFLDLQALEDQMPKKIFAGEIDNLTHIFSCTADQQINCVLHFDGHFNQKLMERAVKLTYYADPVLGSRYVPDEKKAYWERRDDLHTLLFCSFKSSKNIEQEVNSFVTSPIDSQFDLPLRIAFFRRKDGDTLCLKVSHEAIDGQGIKEYIVLLASFYNTLITNPNFLPKPKVDVDRSLKQVFKRLNFFKKLHVISQLRIRKPTWSFPWKSTEAKTRRLQTI